MVAHALLKLYAVAIGYGNVVHVHTEHQAAYVVCISHAGSNTCPCGNLPLSFLALPIAYNYLSWYTHTCADVSKLDIAVSRLVEVHKVHIYRVPRKLGVVLCVEVEQRLLKSLQSLNPHLGWREGVHPCDDTYTLVVVVGSLHHCLHLYRRVGSAFVHHLDRNDAAIVKSLNHIL